MMFLGRERSYGLSEMMSTEFENDEALRDTEKYFDAKNLSIQSHYSATYGT